MKSYEKIETLTGTEYSIVQLTDRGIVYETDSASTELELSESSITLARILIEIANIPVYSNKIKSESGGAIDSVADTYDELIESCSATETGVDLHFLELGRFSGKSRAFIQRTSDEDRIAYANLAILEISFERGDDRRLKRKQKPFIDYIDFIENGPAEDKFTKNRKIAGSLATVIGIGAVSWYVLSKKH